MHRKNKCFIKDYRYQYFLCKEFNITSPLMLALHIVFKFALDPESTFMTWHTIFV